MMTWIGMTRCRPKAPEPPGGANYFVLNPQVVQLAAVTQTRGQG